MEPRKEAICNALAAWIRQRPGLDYANYGDVSGYRAEQRSIARDKREAETLLAAVRWRDSITADMILEAARSAYSGRLSMRAYVDKWCDGVKHDVWCEDGKNERVTIDYCTGQYWPTEYRRAACAVVASALWEWQRQNMPAPVCDDPNMGRVYRSPEHADRDYVSAGAWLRAHFRKEFGKGIASRWFR
jgi:hypothetical protein